MVVSDTLIILPNELAVLLCVFIYFIQAELVYKYSQQIQLALLQLELGTSISLEIIP